MKLTPDFSLLAILVIFFLNYLVVRRFLLTPINRILVERGTEHRTAEQLYDAALSKFNQATAAMEANIQNAKREAASLRDRFRSEAGAYRTTVLDRTRVEAEHVVNDAGAKLTQEVAVARERIAGESESLARLAAERILGRAV